MQYIKIDKSGTITLPKETLKSFPALTELVIWWKGDSLVLKRISPFRPSEFAGRAPAKEMKLPAIVKETHQLRKEKRRG